MYLYATWYTSIEEVESMCHFCFGSVHMTPNTSGLVPMMLGSTILTYTGRGRLVSLRCIQVQVRTVLELTIGQRECFSCPRVSPSHADEAAQIWTCCLAGANSNALLWSGLGPSSLGKRIGSGITTRCRLPFPPPPGTPCSFSFIWSRVSVLRAQS